MDTVSTPDIVRVKPNSVAVLGGAMAHCQCRTLMCRLDTLTHCRIRWVCDAHDKAMLR